MLCPLHPAAPGPTTPVTPSSVPHSAMHCHLVHGCRPNAPAQAPFLPLQLMRLVAPLRPFTSDWQPQPCWGASPLPSCLLSWWLAPPTPCMYVHVHLFICEWILGDLGATSFFKHHQLPRSPHASLGFFRSARLQREAWLSGVGTLTSLPRTPFQA